MADEAKIINDEEFKKATAGTDSDRGRTTTGTVVGPGVSSEYIYRIMADDGRDIRAYYYAVGKLLEPGTRVKVELVGQAQWEIIEFL
ncbi:MAG: hypothetical protein K5770_14750 [Lachnospiraceae bacterium]|nr:hypothetical protein [Lachnospiraceae bacterium]